MRRRSAIALTVVVVLLVATPVLRWSTRPETVGPRILDMAGRALDLEITAEQFEYRVAGGPRLVLRGVHARVPGATAPMIQAERVLVALPWSTLRARGAEPTVSRIELDAPQVQLQAFMAWWSRRARGEGPLPTLSEGLRVDRGRVDGGDWSLRDISIDLPHFAPDARVRGRVRGGYYAPSVQVPFDLRVAVTRPATGAGIGIAGTATPRAGGWRMPATLILSARLGAQDDAAMRLHGLRLSADARYVSGATMQRFALGFAGESTYADGVLRLAPAALALRGRDLVPRLQARGDVAFGPALEFAWAGRIQGWPAAWPALPPPLAGAGTPLPFSLQYHGAGNLSDPVGLQLEYQRATFNARLRVAEVAAWMGDDARTPLPPIEGRLEVPRIEVAGASLHGVTVNFEDDTAAGVDQP